MSIGDRGLKQGPKWGYQCCMCALSSSGAPVCHCCVFSPGFSEHFGGALKRRGRRLLLLPLPSRKKERGTHYQPNRTWGERFLPLLTPKPLPPPNRGRGRLGAGPRPVDSSPAKRSEERERERQTKERKRERESEYSVRGIVLFGNYLQKGRSTPVK